MVEAPVRVAGVAAEVEAMSTMRPVSELHGFQCGECNRKVDVWTSNRNGEVGAKCCGQPMRACFTMYPKNMLDAALDGTTVADPRDLIGWDE